MTNSRQRLEQIAAGFMPARILLTAVELDVFVRLGTDDCTAEELAVRTGAEREPLERLLNALVALRILKKRSGRYRNGTEARRHLTADADEFLGDIMLHRVSLWESWSRLTSVVRTGTVPPRRRTRKREKRFIKGMANIGASSAAQTVRALRRELTSVKRLLDLGGGPATYACAFARAKRGLRATVLDLPGPLTYARETIAEQRMKGRVTVRAADALTAASYGRGYDMVFMSNFIHVFKRPSARVVVEKAARALRKGGRLAIKDFYLDEERTSPRFAAIFSMNMLAADAGDCYTRGEVAAWMTAAGVRPGRFVNVAETSGILVGTKV